MINVGSLLGRIGVSQQHHQARLLVMTFKWPILASFSPNNSQFMIQGLLIFVTYVLMSYELAVASLQHCLDGSLMP